MGTYFHPEFAVWDTEAQGSDVSINYTDGSDEDNEDSDETQGLCC